MTTTFRLTDKRQGSEFLLDSLTGGAYTMSGGLQLFSRDQRALWHTGIDGVSRLLRLVHGDYGAAFQVSLGGSWTDAHKRLAILERWLNQANEAAFNTGRTWPVYLGVQVDGMVSESYHRIVYATMDTQASLVNPVTLRASNNMPVYGATIVLSLAPGTRQYPIEVGTALSNGATEEWTDDGMLPLHWLKAGSPTFERNYDRVLIGDSSVKITATTAGDGITTVYTEVPVNHLGIGTAWISMDSGSSVWGLRIYVAGEGAVAEQTGITYTWLQTNALDTHTDANGNRWYLVSCTQAPEDLVLTTLMRLDFYLITSGGSNVVYFNGGVLKTVKTVTMPPSPDNVKGVDSAGFDTVGLGAYTTVASDETNKFEGIAGYDVTFNTTTSSAGYFNTRLFMEEAAGETFVAQFWARMVSDGGATAIVEMVDGAGNVLASQEFDNGGGATDLSAVASASYQGVDEQTWYAIRMTGTNSLAPGVGLSFRPTNTGSGDDFQFYLGSTYLYRADDMVADTVFISERYLWNRDDPSTSAPNRAGSVLIFNLPGDRNALLDWEIEPYNYSGATSKIVRMWSYPARRRKGAPRILEAEGLTTHGSLWTGPSDASASGGYVARLTATGSPSTDYIYYRIPPEKLADWSSAPYQIYVRAKTSQASGASVWMAVSTNGGQTVDTFDPVTFGSTSYEWLYLGTVNLRYSEGRMSSGRGLPAVDLRIYASHTTPQTISIDYVAPRPAIEDRHAAWRFPEFAAYDRFVVMGSDQTVIRRMAYIPGIGSPPWSLEPGPVAHRVMLTQTTTSEVHVLADYVNFRLTVWPQTSNLSGLT